MSPPIRAPSHSALSNGNNARAGGCAVISDSRFTPSIERVNLWKGEPSLLMVPIKTIIRSSDFREDSWGGRMLPPPSWQTPSKINTRRGVLEFLPSSSLPRENFAFVQVFSNISRVFLRAQDTLEKAAEVARLLNPSSPLCACIYSPLLLPLVSFQFLSQRVWRFMFTDVSGRADGG